MADFDVVVAGLGITGAAAAGELASRGRRVLGVDARVPPHTHGSSHGQTRIIREAYYEHPLYVPLVQRAYERWCALERQSGRTLLRTTGALHLGPADGELVTGVMRSVTDHRLDHSVLDPPAIRRRYPALTVPPGEVGVLEPRAGALLAEACLEACMDAARAAGASLHLGDALLGWRTERDAVTVTLGSGPVRATRLVLSLGPWLPRFLGHDFEVERQFALWFEPREDDAGHGIGRLPIVLREYAPSRIVYTFPDLGHGIKASVHHEGERCDPDTVERSVRPAEEAHVRRLLEGLMPGAAGRVLATSVCLYTNTPDRHFAIGSLEDGYVIVASACSGHGFKFAPAIAELIADLVEDAEPDFDLTPFRLDRLA